MGERQKPPFSARKGLKEGLRELEADYERMKREFEKAAAQKLSLEDWGLLADATKLQWAIRELNGEAEPGFWMSPELKRKFEERRRGQKGRDARQSERDYAKGGRSRAAFAPDSVRHAMSGETAELLGAGLFEPDLSKAGQLSPFYQAINAAEELKSRDMREPQKIQGEIEYHAKKMMTTYLQQGIDRTLSEEEKLGLLGDFRQQALINRNRAKDVDFHKMKLRQEEDAIKGQEIYRASDRIHPAFLQELTRQINSTHLKELLEEERTGSDHDRWRRGVILKMGGGAVLEESGKDWAENWLRAHGANDGTLYRNTDNIEERRVHEREMKERLAAEAEVERLGQEQE